MARKTYTLAGEIVKFFGVMLLATRFEFGSRASLWSNVTTNKYIPAPSFGQTGMPRKRFDDLWMCIRFSEQPPNRPSGVSLEWSKQPQKNSQCLTCPTWSWSSGETTRDWWPGEPTGNQQCCRSYGWIGTDAISSPVHHR